MIRVTNIVKGLVFSVLVAGMNFGFTGKAQSQQVPLFDATGAVTEDGRYHAPTLSSLTGQFDSAVALNTDSRIADWAAMARNGDIAALVTLVETDLRSNKPHAFGTFIWSWAQYRLGALTLSKRPEFPADLADRLALPVETFIADRDGDESGLVAIAKTAMAQVQLDYFVGITLLANLDDYGAHQLSRAVSYRLLKSYPNDFYLAWMSTPTNETGIYETSRWLNDNPDVAKAAGGQLLRWRMTDRTEQDIDFVDMATLWLEQQPDDFYALRRLGIANQSMGRFAEASKNFAASEHANPFFELAYERWGAAVVRQQDWSGAEAIATQSAKLEVPPQRVDLEAQLKLARIMHKAGEYGRGRSAYQAALVTLDDSDPVGLKLRAEFAEFLLDEGFADEALEQVEKDFEENPARSDIAIAALKSLDGLSRYSDVISGFQRFRDAGGVLNDDTIYYLGRAYNALKRPAEAAALLGLVTDVAPEAYWMQGNIAYWIEQTGDASAAFEQARDVALLRGDSGWTIRTVMRNARKSKRDEEAQEFLDVMLARYPYAEELWKQKAKAAPSEQDVWLEAINRLPQLAFPVINLAKAIEGENYENWRDAVDIGITALDRMAQNGANRGQVQKVLDNLAEYHDNAIHNGQTSSMDDLNTGLDFASRAREHGLAEKDYWRIRQFLLRRAGASKAYTEAAMNMFDADPDYDDNVGVLFQGEVGQFLSNSNIPFLMANRFLQRKPRDTKRLLHLAHRHEKWGGSPVVAISHLEAVKRWDPNAEDVEERLRSAYQDLGGHLRYHEERYHQSQSISSSERFINWFETSRAEARKDQPVLKTIDLNAMKVVLLHPDGIEEETHYDPITGRVLYFRIGASEMRIAYLETGELSKIAVGRSQFVGLEYDTPAEPLAERFITRLTTSDALPITFSYNAAGKPVRVSIEGKGTLLVTYDANNEITDVETVDLPEDGEGAGGWSLSLQVTKTFQKLLRFTKAVQRIDSSSFDILSDEMDPGLAVVYEAVEDRYDDYDEDWTAFVTAGNRLASALIERIADDPEYRLDAENILDENYNLTLERQNRAIDEGTGLSDQDHAGIAAAIESIGLWHQLNAEVRAEGLSKYVWQQWLEMQNWAMAQDVNVPAIAGATAKLRAQITNAPLHALSSAGWLRTSKLSNPGFWRNHPTGAIFPPVLVEYSGALAKDILVRQNGDIVAISDVGFSVLRRGFWEWFAFDVVEQRYSVTADTAELDATSHINSIIEDNDGRLWLGLKNGLAMIQDDYAIKPRLWLAGQDGLPRAPVEALALSSNSLAVGGTAGLAIVALDQLTIETIDDAPVLNLSGHENGMLVIGRNKLWALTDEMRQQITDFQVTDAFYDPFDGGRLYVLRGKNLFSVNWNGIDELTGKLSLVTGQESIVSTDAPYGLTQVLVFEDELALAVLTDQGLSIYRDGGFEHLSVPDQDQNIPIRAVSSNSGQTFLATSVGISAIETGQVQHDLSGRAYDLLTDVSQGVTFVARGNRLDVVEHATADAGSRWFAGIAATELALAPDGSLISNDGLTVVRIRRGTTEVQELFTAEQTVVGDRAAGPVRSILAAKDGSVWATAGASLFHWQDGQELIEFTLFKHDPAFDVHSDMLSTVFETVSGDIMLVASSEGHRNYRKSTMNGGLFRYNGDGFDLVDDADVLGRWFVSGYTDLGGGTALAGTTGGFSRHNGQKFEELDLLNDSSYLKLKERLPSLFLGTRGAKLGKDLWLFGTAGGIVAYSGGAWIYPDRLNWMLPGQEYASYGSRTVHAVETDPIGRIYVATDFGLTIYDPKGASAENFLIRQNRGNSAFETLEKRRMGEVADVLLDALPDDSDAAKLAEKLEKSRKALADLERRLDTANQLNDPQASKLKKASIRAKQRNIGLLAELEAKAPVLFSMLQLNPLDLQSMSGRLPDDLVVAQFLPTADRLFINLVSSKGTEVREVEVTADALFSTTLSVVKSMALGAKGAKSVVGFALSPTTPTAHAVDGVLTQQLAWLYDQLLRPIEHAVSDGQTLVISPVGVLSNLPFNALVSDMSDDKPKYAVQSWPIAVAPSLYALDMMMSHTDSYSTNHVVFGDPDGSLPGARAEAEEIAAILEPDNVELRQGEDATYDELLLYAEDARFLHLATHGKLDHKSPRNSYLLLAEGRRLNLPQIMTLPLENTDLVFLSACETGIGTDGLEYRTIAHAFAHAGAPAVVASFWQVEDSATKQLALAFYESKMDGLENSAALAAAQNSMIQAGGENAHPNRWASFAVFGKP